MEEHDSYYISPEEFDNLGEKFKVITSYINQNSDVLAKQFLLSLDAPDLAHYIDDSSDDIRTRITEILGDDFDPETLIWIDDGIMERFYNILGYSKVAKMISTFAIEDAIAAIENLDDDIRCELLDQLPQQQQEQIREGLQYPENSAGRIMERDYIVFPDFWNVGQAIDAIRKRKNQEEELNSAIITNFEKRPIGLLQLSQLLRYSNNTSVKEIMNDEIKVATALIEQEEIAYAFKQYSLDIVPITNSRGKLIGIVSVQSMVHIIDKQAEEELMHLAGINEKDLYQSYLSTAKLRFPWLFVNLITASLTAIITSLFEVTISKMITIAAVMPIVIAISSNVGTQTVTVVVRALSSRDINDNNYFKVVIKETAVSFFNSLGVAFIGGVLLYGIFFNLKLSLIFAVATIISFILAGFLGATIPIFLSRLGLDPAISSNILLTAMTDAIGVLSFLCLAYFLIA
jgi:magnesium transporter